MVFIMNPLVWGFAVVIVRPCAEARASPANLLVRHEGCDDGFDEPSDLHRRVGLGPP